MNRLVFCLLLTFHSDIMRCVSIDLLSHVNASNILSYDVAWLLRVDMDMKRVRNSLVAINVLFV